MPSCSPPRPSLPTPTVQRRSPTSRPSKPGSTWSAIPYTIAPRLVRGLDYYVSTTFEFAGGTLDSAQNALGGGGRYDGLVEALGGPPTPGIGFALGVDRILLACDDEEVFDVEPASVDVFVVDTTGGAASLAITEELRRAGISADRAFDGRSMKAQMKAADRSGATTAIIVGADELDAGTVLLKPLRGDGEQVTVKRVELVDRLHTRVTQIWGRSCVRPRRRIFPRCAW